MAQEPLRDCHGRAITYARLSITDRCDYRCQFCLPERDDCRGVDDDRLSGQDIFRLARVLAGMGVTSFKVTGGEPFMNPDALGILAGLRALPEITSLTVTTNGSTLDRYAEALAGIRVDGVNVSLNAIDPERYRAVTRTGRDVESILRSVVGLKQRGLAVKLNMVPIRGVNDADIVPLVRFALLHDIGVRFIELMPLGEGRHFSGLGRDEVMAIVEKEFGTPEPVSERFGSGPARYWRLPGHDAPVGYIAAMSHAFCDQCNRIRLTSRGFLKTCLHHGHGEDLAGPLRNGETDDALAERIRRIVRDKPAGHSFNAPDHGALDTVSMSRIGG